MTAPAPVADSERSTPPQPTSTEPVRRGRVLELDILRGFLLVWMTLTHLPTKASIVSNQTFGFVSGAEGFIFLAAFMIGRIEEGIEQTRGRAATIGDVARRTMKIYGYHCLLLAIAFTLVAAVGVSFHRQALENLLSFYLQSPRKAIVAAALLKYRPSLLDILPIYIIFLIWTPVARAVARRWSWKPVLAVSIGVWVAAQFGLRGWMYQHGDPFGLSVPETSTGAFDLYAWQLLWTSGLALGSVFADRVSGVSPAGEEHPLQVPRWLLIAAFVVAACFVVLRYSPVDQWMSPDVYGRLIDKWHLGPARIVDFTAISIILIRFGAQIAKLPLLGELAPVGRASIEVFSVHVLCCVGANALSHDADPMLPGWQQVLVLGATMTALFVTAKVANSRAARRHATGASSSTQMSLRLRKSSA